MKIKKEKTFGAKLSVNTFDLPDTPLTLSIEIFHMLIDARVVMWTKLRLARMTF